MVNILRNDSLDEKSACHVSFQSGLLDWKLLIFPILRKQYCTFLYCSPHSFRSSYFVTAKVVALNLFVSFLVSVLYIDSWLFFLLTLFLAKLIAIASKREKVYTMYYCRNSDNWKEVMNQCTEPIQKWSKEDQLLILLYSKINLFSQSNKPL